MESTFFRVVFLSLISLNANVFGVENLTFFGQYVVFRPTQFVKFDLREEMDIVLLEYRRNQQNLELQVTDYLYRIRLIIDKSVTEEVGVNCIIQRNGGNIVVQGQYKFWNETEKLNMAVSWSSEERMIKVLTQFEGYYSNIFSWKDRSKSRASVKYIGLAVAPTSSETNLDNFNHRHLNWNMREAEPADVDIRNAYNMCSMKLLSGDPSNESSNATTLYQISITREADQNFLVSLQKRNKEVLRATSSQMDCKKLVISWVAKDKVLCFGLKNDTAPIFLWQDTEENGYDYNNIKYVTIQSWSRKFPLTIEVAKIKFLTIPELFPRYFSGELNANRKNETPNTTV